MTKCQNNLKQLGLALHQFESDNGFFPQGDRKGRKNGTSLLSGTPGVAIWCLILPYIEQGANTGQQANAAPIPFLLCPSRRDTAAGARTDYAACMNPSEYHPKTATPALRDTTGFFGVGYGYDANNKIPPVNNALITSLDGTSCTIYLAHKAVHPKKLNAPIVAGDGKDGYFTELTGYMNSARGWGNDGTYTYQFWPDSLIATNSSGQDLLKGSDISKMFSSPHGVMPVLFVDGSVQLFDFVVSDDLAIRLWSYNDGTAIQGTELP